MTTTVCFCHELNRSANELPHKSFSGILRTLASYANPSGNNCYPNLRRLAKSSGYSLAWIHKVIIWAEQNGWLKINRQSGVSKGQGWRRSSYILLVPHWTGRGRKQKDQRQLRARCSPQGKHVSSATPFRYKPDASLIKPKGNSAQISPWERLRRLISTKGRYDNPQVSNGYHGLPEQAIAIIQRLGGWGTLCSSTEYDLDTRIQAAFNRLWEIEI